MKAYIRNGRKVFLLLLMSVALVTYFRGKDPLWVYFWCKLLIGGIVAWIVIEMLVNHFFDID
jgi:hypothetical protein